jgi:glycosyltransferase involved in cell wall biosynthesis
MSDPLISVVLCTYNPRTDYLQRCVDGLRKQTLDQTAWELVVVDNNSQPAVRLIRPKDQEPERSGTADSPKANSARRSRGQTKSPKDAQSEQAVEIDLSWHPRARIVVETQQGLSHARRRAFGEAKGDLIVNLDDDAVLDKDYLSQVVALAERLPLIGAFGCQIRPEFEQKPDWPVEEYYGAQRAVPQAVWSNDPTHYASNPWCAERWPKPMLVSWPRTKGLPNSADRPAPSWPARMMILP